MPSHGHPALAHQSVGVSPGAQAAARNDLLKSFLGHGIPSWGGGLYRRIGIFRLPAGLQRVAYNRRTEEDTTTTTIHPENHRTGNLGRRGRALAAWAAVAILMCVLTSSRIRLIDSLGDQGHFAKYTHFAGLINAGELPAHRLGDLSPGYLWTVAGLSGPLGLGLPEVRALQIWLVSLNVASRSAELLMLKSASCPGAILCSRRRTRSISP